MICSAIKAAIATSRYDYEGLGSLIGVSYDQLNNIANGRTRPKPEVIDAIRATLDLPADWPWSAAGQPMPGQRVTIAGTKLVPISIVGSVAAGAGSNNVDVDLRKVYVPENLARVGKVGFIVEGDSLAPFLEDGDTAVIKERRKPLHGYPFLVRMPDHSDRLKVMAFDRGDWYMVSVNPRYQREPLPNGAEIVGILVGYFRVRGARETMVVEPAGLRPDALPDWTF